MTLAQANSVVSALAGLLDKKKAVRRKIKPQVVFTEEMDAVLRDLHKEGASQVVIAENIGVSVPIISRRKKELGLRKRVAKRVQARAGFDVVKRP